MVKNNQEIQKDTKTVKLVPNFKIEQDVRSTDPEEDVVISNSDLDVIEEACPHFKILKDRYAQYRGPDVFGNPDKIPTPINRRHSLTSFVKLVANADLSKGLKIQPTRLIRTFVYDEETEKKKPYLIVSQLIVGQKPDGTDTHLTSVSIGYYEFPLQFKQDLDGDWEPVNNKFKKVWYIPFTKEVADKYAKIGDPHIKKYTVQNLDGTRQANLTYKQFLDISDEEGIKLSETTVGR